MIAGKHIVLGVSGGVAAYKAVYLARRLVERGAEVRVVMTESATKFVGPATLAAVTGSHPVLTLFGDADVSPHTALARWADVMVVAPATASTLSKLSNGDASNALVATALATTAPIVVAPAMHTEMWEHPATQKNISVLEAFGYEVVRPEEGDLAGGDRGMGRLADPDVIADIVGSALGKRDMAGVRVLITAGGTREAIDPVRYLGNRSSGKMGNALALEAASRGASVTIVTTAPAPSHPAITCVTVETAEEMADAVWTRSSATDVAIMAAAVADFRPKDPSGEKLRRDAGPPTISLEPTPDILAGLQERGEVGIVVGFAAETGSLEEAATKAKRKGVPLLVANDVSREGAGFGSDTNQVTLIHEDGSTTELPMMHKREVARAIFDAVMNLRG